MPSCPPPSQHFHAVGFACCLRECASPGAGTWAQLTHLLPPLCAPSLPRCSLPCNKSRRDGIYYLRRGRKLNLMSNLLYELQHVAASWRRANFCRSEQKRSSQSVVSLKRPVPTHSDDGVSESQLELFLCAVRIAWCLCILCMLTGVLVFRFLTSEMLRNTAWVLSCLWQRSCHCQALSCCKALYHNAPLKLHKTAAAEQLLKARAHRSHSVSASPPALAHSGSPACFGSLHRATPSKQKAWNNAEISCC